MDEQHRRLLQFLIPVLHLEKPTRITITLHNTIFGALTRNRKVDWARITSDLVAQLAERVGKNRATPLCPYLFHLYHNQQLLTPTEEKTWGIQETLLKYVESETDDEVETGSESEPETEGEEAVTLQPPSKQQMTTPPFKRRWTTIPSTPEEELRPQP